MTPFEREVEQRISANAKNEKLRTKAESFLQASIKPKYSYNFFWLGRPIIQYPQDIVAIQEIIWSVQPDLIIEAGIAHGGSLILSASILELNAACGGFPDAEVIGIDVDIRTHNRRAIEAHPMFKRITMIQGSSIAPDTIKQVLAQAQGKNRIMVFLDSNHTHKHVLTELNMYAPLTSVNSYCVVFDTIIEDMPAEKCSDRPWSPGNSPRTALLEFLSTHPEFGVDKDIGNKLLISAAPDGFLKRLS